MRMNPGANPGACYGDTPVWCVSFFMPEEMNVRETLCRLRCFRRNLGRQFAMGGRGASSGISANGKQYGSEFQTLMKISNIKFVKANNANNAKDPLETMTKGRVYVTVNGSNQLNSINYYDPVGKRIKSINLLHDHNEIKGDHKHIGYYHDETGGTHRLTPQEKKLVAFVKQVWYNQRSK